MEWIGNLLPWLVVLGTVAAILLGGWALLRSTRRLERRLPRALPRQELDPGPVARHQYRRGPPDPSASSPGAGYDIRPSTPSSPEPDVVFRGKAALAASASHLEQSANAPNARVGLELDQLANYLPGGPIMSRLDRFTADASSLEEARQLLAEHGDLPEPRLAQHMMGAGGPIESDVVCSVFAPPKVKCGTRISVQAFLHHSEDLIRAVLRATEGDRSARRRGAATLTKPVRLGTLIQFFLDSPQLIVTSQQLQQVRWRGQPTSATFTAEVPSTMTKDVIDGVLHVAMDEIPIGEISFTIYVDRENADRPKEGQILTLLPTSSQEAAARPMPVGTAAHQYKRSFISYSRADFSLVSFFAQGLAEKGITPCIDVNNLEPGDEWEERLPAHIERADVFYLMWSDNAAKSQYVDWECRHAVGLNKLDRQPKRPRIKPIPLHSPWPAPPEYLRPFHFYSTWHAHRAAQAGGLIKPSDVINSAPGEQGDERSGLGINDIAQTLDPKSASAIWSRFRAGQRGIMVRSIYTAKGRKVFDEVTERYSRDGDFRGIVDQFLADFEQSVRNMEQKSPSSVHEYLLSDTGRIYLLLAHATNRLV